MKVLVLSKKERLARSWGLEIPKDISFSMYLHGESVEKALRGSLKIPSDLGKAVKLYDVYFYNAFKYSLTEVKSGITVPLLLWEEDEFNIEDNLIIVEVTGERLLKWIEDIKLEAEAWLFNNPTFREDAMVPYMQLVGFVVDGIGNRYIIDEFIFLIKYLSNLALKWFGIKLDEEDIIGKSPFFD